MQQYCVSNFGIASSDFFQQFEIPESLDYVA